MTITRPVAALVVAATFVGILASGVAQQDPHPKSSTPYRRPRIRSSPSTTAA
jgi:hypothetical protein